LERRALSVGPIDPQVAAEGVVLRSLAPGEEEDWLRVRLSDSQFDEAGANCERWAARWIASAQRPDFEPEGYFVALLDGRIVGELETRLRPYLAADIYYPRVLPAHRDGPVAARLVRHALNYCNQRGFRVFDAVWHVRKKARDDKALRTFYRRLGFEELPDNVIMARSPGRRDAVTREGGLCFRSLADVGPAAFAQAMFRSFQNGREHRASGKLCDVEAVMAYLEEAGADHGPAVEEGADRSFVAFASESPVAAALVVPGFIQWIGTVLGARGRGYGAALLRHVIGHEARSDGRILSLLVDEKNEPALRLYQRHGFVPLSGYREHVWRFKFQRAVVPQLTA
jgi:ribosomal protein S18 acetylase RimI-like enzyme